MEFQSISMGLAFVAGLASFPLPVFSLWYPHILGILADAQRVEKIAKATAG